MCTSFILGKNVTHTSQSMFDERLFSATYLYRLRLKQGREIQNFIFGGREFQRDAPAKDMLQTGRQADRELD